MNGRIWMAARVALALVLMAGFYLLSLGLGVGLLWLAYAEVVYARVRSPKLLMLTAGSGLLVLWGTIPRRDRFVPPGPRVAEDDEPALFDAIYEVAHATNQPVPSDVFIVGDVNAFVTRRGGILGIGSRRVMGVGLLLMQAVTVQELKAILAHEFGHYHSGDVALGPWVYRTRASIGRMLRQLSGNVLQKVFVAYGTLFVRVTHAVSRRQEFIADEVAARFAGAGAAISGLRKVHGAAAALPGYWQVELAPVLGSGYLPPITEGFSHFMAAEPIAPMVQSALQESESNGQTNPFDTHPSLRDRVAALSAFPAGPPGDTRCAVALLRDVRRWERRVLGAQINEDWAGNLKPLEWDEVVKAVYLPIFRAGVEKMSDTLRAFTIASVPTYLVELARLGTRLVGPEEPPASGEARAARMVQLLAHAIIAALVSRGWSAQTTVGNEITVRHGELEFRPLSELRAVVAGTVPTSTWKSRCLALGIAEVPLVAGSSGPT